MTDGFKAHFVPPPPSRSPAQPLLWAAALLYPAAAAASHGHEPVFTDLIPYWINFIIYVGALYALLRRPLPRLWDQRRESIAREIAHGQAELKAAQARLEEAEKNLLLSDVRVKDLLAASRQQTAKEVAEIAAQARAKADAVMQQAQQTAAAEWEAARRAVQAEIADLVIEHAAAKLRAALSAEQDRKLRDAALSGAHMLLTP